MILYQTPAPSPPEDEYYISGVFNSNFSQYNQELTSQGRFMRFVSNIFYFFAKIFAFTSFMMGLYFYKMIF